MRKVIDTNVFVHAFSQEGLSLACFHLISEFMQEEEDQLAVDYGSRIVDEYNSNLANNAFFRECWKQLKNRNRIAYGDGEMPHRNKKHLIELGFHEPEDHVFLGTAFNTDKYLISDDSDYGNKGEQDKKYVHEYITTEMNVHSISSETALREYRENR